MAGERAGWNSNLSLPLGSYVVFSTVNNLPHMLCKNVSNKHKRKKSDSQMFKLSANKAYELPSLEVLL